MKPALLAALSLLMLPLAAQAGPREEVMAADRAFSKLSAAKGSDYAFWANVARDGRLYGPSGPPVIGKAATVPSPGTDQTVLTWEPTAAGADDRLGWTDGRWSEIGPHGTIAGHYLTVWVKEDGTWKVQADMGTTDPQPNPKSRLKN